MSVSDESSQRYVASIYCETSRITTSAVTLQLRIYKFWEKPVGKSI